MPSSRSITAACLAAVCALSLIYFALTRPSHPSDTAPASNLITASSQPAKTSASYAQASLFWKQCRKLQNCPQQLTNLKQQNAPHYDFYQQFAQRQQTFNQLLEESLNSRSIPLAEQLKIVKQAQREAWPDQPDIFFDEINKLYDLQAQLPEVIDQLQGQTAAQIGEALEQFWQEKHLSYSDLTKYDMALKVYRALLPENEFTAIQASLAEQYLPPEQASAINQHLQIQQENKRQIDRYQTSLLALKTQLAHERELNQPPLNAEQRSAYEQEALQQFKLAFFK